MKKEARKGVFAIKTDTAEAFNEQIAVVLQEHPNAKVHFISNFLGAYVEYEDVVEVPESLAEQYELAGDRRERKECPYFVRTQDKRFKWHFCVQKQKKVTECQGACETYYQLLEELIKEAQR